MVTRIISAALAGVFLLAACATAVGTAYAPADKRGYGFSDTRVESDRFRVTFAGDGATPPEAVEDFALLRAADLAIENGFDWFRVIGRSVDVQEKGGVGLGAGLGTGSVGRSSSVGVGVSSDLGTIGARKFYTARLEILCGKGAAPSADTPPAGAPPGSFIGSVYDARDVAQTIRSRIGAPPAAS